MSKHTIFGIQKIDRIIIIIVTAAALLLPSPARAWPAKVLEILEGDTIVVLHNGKPEMIRLFGIDCPEKGQAFAYKAKMMTARLTAARIVHVSPSARDGYGRNVAWVSLGTVNINLELVEKGLAWHYKKHGYDRKLAEAEEAAREAELGLWRDPAPVPPWIFRIKNGIGFKEK